MRAGRGPDIRAGGQGPDNPKTQKELIQSHLPISIDKTLLF